MRVCPPLLCPVCASPLVGGDGSLHCADGHSFDRSRHGFVDLLPHGHGRSGRTGDSREMILARSRFLDAGHYEPLRQRVIELVREEVTVAVSARGRESAAPAGRGAGLEAARSPVVVDAGCGDGYYLHGVATSLSDACCIGFDISPFALRAAARRCRDCTLFLNDVTHRICLPDASADCVLDIFAPRNGGEFARVLRPGGLLLVVIPAADHLAGITDLLPVGAAPDKRATALASLGDGFVLEGCEEVRLGLKLDGAAVADLVAMTPSARHLEAGELERISALAEGREVVAAFEVLRLRAGDPGVHHSRTTSSSPP